MNPSGRFLAACRCKPCDRHPVWLMRQAGRYLPGYQDLREKYDFLTLCKRPDLIFEISLEPWRLFGMDAVIVFSDILLPIQAMGQRLWFDEEKGPRFETTIQTKKDVEGLSIPNIRISFPYLLEAIQNLKYEIREDAALLGFIGAPWTLAAYSIEGGSGDFSTALKLLDENPNVVSGLLEKITTTVTLHAVEQIRSGADAIQIFDTWGGLLSAEKYQQFILPYMKKIVVEIQKAGAPAILFVKNSAHLLKEMADSGADVISIGSDTDMSFAIKTVGEFKAIQGNLNPEVLLRSPSTVERETRKLLDSLKGRSGYIANLGHGVLPQTPIESVRAFVETVKHYNE